MQLELISSRIYLIHFINKFMESQKLIFFNSGESKVCNNYGEKIDVDIYNKGTLHIKIGTKESYEQNIRPNLAGTIYREHQIDFISIVQLDRLNDILGALVTAEPSQSQIVKSNFKLLKKQIKMCYTQGMASAEEGFDDFNQFFKKYYWSNDVLGKEDIFDWQGGRPKLRPINESNSFG